MTQPDFLIIGAMKCGTSTLQAQLAAQDGIFMTDPKEPNYFSDDAVFARGGDWYSTLFRDAGPDDLRGEASTHYTKLPTYPRTLDRMRDVLKAPRLVYMIRNPVDRAVSHYLHERSMGVFRKGLATAIEAHPEVVDYGRYGMQIAPYVDAYGADTVLLTSLELLRADPDGELHRIARFIGFRGEVVWQHSIRAQNVSAERFRRIPAQEFVLGHPVLRWIRQSLIPPSFRAWVRQQRAVEPRPELPADLRARLEGVFLDDRQRLAEFFPSHPALAAAYPFAPL